MSGRSQGRRGPIRIHAPAPEAGRARRGRPFLPHPRQACGAGEGGAPLPPEEDEAVEKRRPAAVGVRPGAPAPSAGAITRSRAMSSRTPAGHYLAALRARGAPAPGRAALKTAKGAGRGGMDAIRPVAHAGPESATSRRRLAPKT